MCWSEFQLLYKIVLAPTIFSLTKLAQHPTIRRTVDKYSLYGPKEKSKMKNNNKRHDQWTSPGSGTQINNYFSGAVTHKLSQQHCSLICLLLCQASYSWLLFLHLSTSAGCRPARWENTAFIFLANLFAYLINFWGYCLTWRLIIPKWITLYTLLLFAWKDACYSSVII